MFVVPLKFAVPVTVRSFVLTLFTLISRAKATLKPRPVWVISMFLPASKVTVSLPLTFAVDTLFT